MVLATGVILYVTYVYYKSPQGKQAIRNGAVAIHNGRIIAGKAISEAGKAAVKIILVGGVYVWNKTTSLLVTKDKADKEAKSKVHKKTRGDSKANRESKVSRDSKAKRDSKTKISKKAEEHIIENHGSDSTVPNKSKFDDDFNIIKEINNALTNTNSTSTPTTNGRIIIEYTYKDPIGTNSNGKLINTIRVIVDALGRVITAYPVK